MPFILAISFLVLLVLYVLWHVRRVSRQVAMLNMLTNHNVLNEEDVRDIVNEETQIISSKLEKTIKNCETMNMTDHSKEQHSIQQPQARGPPRGPPPRAGSTGPPRPRTQQIPPPQRNPTTRMPSRMPSKNSNAPKPNLVPKPVKVPQKNVPPVRVSGFMATKKRREEETLDLDEDSLPEIPEIDSQPPDDEKVQQNADPSVSHVPPMPEAEITTPEKKEIRKTETSIESKEETKPPPPEIEIESSVAKTKPKRMTTRSSRTA